MATAGSSTNSWSNLARSALQGLNDSRYGSKKLPQPWRRPPLARRAAPADVAQFAGVDAARTRLGSQPLEVPHTSEDGPQFVAKGDFFGQPIDGFVPLGQACPGRSTAPRVPVEVPDHPWGACPVQNFHQRGAVFVVRVQDFKVAHREPVKPHRRRWAATWPRLGCGPSRWWVRSR